MPTAKPSDSGTIKEADLRKSFEAFMQEHSPERLRNHDAIMDLPYAMLLSYDADTDVTSFRVLLNTVDGSGLVPATLHVTTDQMANHHFEPHSHAHDFMDDGRLAKCQGVFGHVSLDTASTYSIEGHGYGHPDWSTKLTAERLSARVAEPSERWYRCLVYDVMDAQERIAEASGRTPIATDCFEDVNTCEQPSLDICDQPSL